MSTALFLNVFFGYSLCIFQKLRITVVGDLHGQYFDFVHMIEQVTGKPNPQNPILFNGDFVDRGPWSVEVLLCLYAFKLQYPMAVHFNRGNHESEMTNYQQLEIINNHLWALGSRFPFP